MRSAPGVPRSGASRSRAISWRHSPCRVATLLPATALWTWGERCVSWTIFLSSVSSVSAPRRFRRSSELVQEVILERAKVESIPSIEKAILMVTRGIARATTVGRAIEHGEEVGHDFLRVRCTDPVSTFLDGGVGVRRCVPSRAAIVIEIYATRGVGVSVKGL